MPQAGGSYVFLARSLRTETLGPPDVIPFHLANAFPGPAQHCLRAHSDSRIIPLTSRPKSQHAWLGGALPPASASRSANYNRLGAIRDRDRRRAPLPPHRHHRQNLHRPLGHRGRHDPLAHLRRRDAFQRRPRLRLIRPAPGTFPGFFSPASGTPPCKRSTAISATTTSATSAAK